MLENYLNILTLIIHQNVEFLLYTLYYSIFL